MALPVPSAQVALDLDPLSGEVRGDSGVVVRHCDSLRAHLHAAVRDGDTVGIERDSGGPELAHDPSPVRVGTVERALHEQRLRDLRRGPRSFFVRGGARSPSLWRPCSPPRRPPPSLCEECARSCDGVLQLRFCGRAGEPARQNHDRVVGRAATVDGHLVEAPRHRALEDPGEQLGLAPGASVVRIASIVAMSGASIAAPFAMPPTAESVALTSTSLSVVSVVIIATAARRAAARSSRSRAPTRASKARASILADREGHADQTRLADEHLLGSRPDAGRRRARTCALPPPSGRAGLRVGVTARADDRGSVAAGCSRCERLTRTGAALALLLVKTAAAGTAFRSSVQTRARSGAPDTLIPPRVPTPRSPAGRSLPRSRTVTGKRRRGPGRTSQAARARCWRTGPPVPLLLSPSCRSHNEITQPVRSSTRAVR